MTVDEEEEMNRVKLPEITDEPGMSERSWCGLQRAVNTRRQRLNNTEVKG